MKRTSINNKKIISIIIGVFVGAVILGLGLNRGIIYCEVISLIEKAEILEKNEKYQEAIELLRNAQAKAFTKGLQAKINQNLEKYHKEVGKNKERISKEKIGIISLDSKEYKKGEILVKYKKDKINLKTASGRRGAENLTALKSTKIKKNIKFINASLLEIQDKKTVEQKIAELERDPNVAYAEPNYIYRTFATPNDPSFSELWGLNNTGQVVNGVGGVNDADIDAPEAWDITTGNSNVVIAVIDTGVDYNHPDLSSNIWSNSDEIAENNIDDDGNGYIDDTRGWDFWSYDNDPFDPDSHGTHVSGTIAAIGNNAQGVTGVNWIAKIMPVRFIGPYGGYLSDAILSIDYAVDNGAKILSNSWGGGGYAQALYDAIEAAKDAGVLFVAAAGNSGQDSDLYPLYPAAYNLDNIVSVAATGQSDELASFSNYGVKSVDVGAPGTNIYSTIIPERTAFFSDDMELGPGNWNAEAPWTLSEVASNSPTHSWECPGQPGTNSSLVLSAPLNLSNKNGPQLIFYSWLDMGLGVDDWLFIEISTDGTLWDLLGAIWYNADFTGYVVDLSDYEGENTVYIRFRLYMDSGSDPQMGAYIDDVQFSSFPETYTGNEYDYYNGTSMATPHVSGLAGLLLGYKQNLTWSEIKNLILWNGDQKSSLENKTLTERRINAFKSFEQAPPTGTIRINNNATYTNSSIVTLNLKAWDYPAGGNSGVSHMRFSNNASIWTSWQSYKRTYSWNLIVPTYGGSTTQGRKYVYAQFRDKMGNISTIKSDAIIYDKTAPTGWIKINNGAYSTTNRYVTLYLSASDNYSGVRWMRFSNNGKRWTGWMYYKTRYYKWNITSSFYGGTSSKGTKCVYVMLKDKAGNAILRKDCIVYR